jgi:KaiC/GvpD/RAD55 family RecA-like ATPase
LGNRTDVSLAQIPGISELLDLEKIPWGMLLLSGPAGAGKTMYCRQFLIDGLTNGDHCVFISSSLTESQFQDLFARVDPDMMKKLKFTNPCQVASKKGSALSMSATIRDIGHVIDKARDGREKGVMVRLVVDSLTHMLLLCGEKALMKFMIELSRLLKDSSTMAICTLATSDQRIQSSLSTFTQGILEMKLEDINESLNRSIRLLSIKGIYHNPRWVDFKIADNGYLVFGDQISETTQTCTLCEKVITGTPFVESNFIFDTQHCMETYKRLAGAYGSSISETGLPSEAFNVSFFFIDIVGLSDPLLSVKRQIQKIQALNRLIASCDAFKKASSDKKIIVPTGDGMAVGFLINHELPLELSIQLQRQLYAYNKGKPEEDRLAVRIGLGSGPVFTVTDMNNVQNVWGPGIILARRVMDAGDNGHILLADKLAEELIALKDEYRAIIKPICQMYEIKHGQKITLYSAYSQDFGNPEMPTRVPHGK